MSDAKLSVGMYGDAVKTLHEQLHRLGMELSAGEMARAFYGPATRQAVQQYQAAHSLPVSGNVDERTSALLSAATATPQSTPIPPAGAVNRTRTVNPPLVTTSPPMLPATDGLRLPSIPPATPASPQDVRNLQASLRTIGLAVPQHEYDEPAFGLGTREAVAALQDRYQLPRTGLLDDATRAALADAVAIAVRAEHRVEGRLFFDHGLPAGDITLRLYTQGFGGVETLLGTGKTDDHGHYSVPYDPGGRVVNLTVRAVDVQGKELVISAPKFNAGKQEVLNLVVPASVQPLAMEYQRLTADLTGQIGALETLQEARENDERQDLTLLSEATGWDARLIAMAATAHKLAADTGLPPAALYGLVRTGLPTDTQLLARVDTTTVEQALGKAREAGIVTLSDQEISTIKASFEKFAGAPRRADKAPGALSSFGDLLNSSGLSEAEKAIFEEVHFAHSGGGGVLWQKAREAGIPAQKITGLRLQGKLAYLTHNNAALTQSLQQELGSLDNLVQLVEKDLYKDDAWKSRLRAGTGADEQALHQRIPPAYTGDSAADRLGVYAADLARKVRLSFPTQVVRRMIATDELRLGEHHAAVKTPVCAFLQTASGLGFALGRVPVDTFIRDNWQQLFGDATPAESEATTQSVKKLQRLYQITPTDQALKVLLDEGFTSAHDVVAFPPALFLERFGDKFDPSDVAASLETARLIYQKAYQVKTVVTHSFFTIAKQLDTAPPVYAMSAPAAQREATRTALIKQYPTMESLFGSLDFCECEHCRSVLSPAAYLVDLFQFLDPDDLVWASPAMKPYDVLVERRPDLPHLQLTCENTNTVLPYIDVVNEILEYYVANNTLSEDAVHDTGDATTPELLAEPQNIIPEAYDVLRQARYPLTLPFDLWLETVRRFFHQSGTPLWQVLELFRPTDALFAPAAQPPAYDRAAIFAEYLGLSPTDYRLFTDPDPLAHWFELYGYQTAAAALTVTTNETGQRLDLHSAKALSRRLGVTYQELVDLVRTSFMNPELDALVVLHKLGVDVDDVFRYKGHADYPAFSAKEQAAFEQRLDDLTQTFTASGFNARTWLDTAWQQGAFHRVLVLADPDTGGNFDLTTLQCANGDAADALVFLKINLFVRLWKKLGWTIEATDRALQAFLPQNAQPLTAMNLGTAFKTALLFLAHLKALDERLQVGKNSRQQLLTIWANLPTTGTNPLYAQLFLTRSVLKNDQIFDDPLGRYLSAPNVLIKDHLLALQGALHLTADEIGRILTDAGILLETGTLVLAHVSLLYRYGLLARALRLPVRDLITLKALASLDPCKPLLPDPVTTLADDLPLTQTLGFVDTAEMVKESGFTVEDLDYLLRHRFDPVGKYRPDTDAFLALVKNLAAGIRRIQLEHAVPADASSLTDDLLRQKLALVLPAEVVETFLAMWSGTKEYEAVTHNVSESNALNPEAFTTAPDVRVSYDKLRAVQRFIYRGVLLEGRKQALQGQFPAAMVGTMLDDVQAQARAYFARYLQQSTDSQHPLGFLAASDFDSLFTPVSAALTEADTQDPAQLDQILAARKEADRKKRQILAEAFLPFLQTRLIRQLVEQTMATTLNAETSLTAALLSDLLADPDQSGQPLRTTFTLVTEQGVTAEFFASPDLSGNPLNPAATVTTADLTQAPAGTNSARFTGWVEVPGPGAYRFVAVFGKKDAVAVFRLSALADPVIQHQATQDHEEFSAFAELKVGVLYAFTLEVHNLQGGSCALLVKGETIPEDHLSQLSLSPAATVERVRRAYVLLTKTLQLIQGFGLSEREVRYLLTHPADFDQLDFSKLPTREADAAAALPTQLFTQFLRLVAYSQLKKSLAPDSDDLIGIFEADTLDDVYKRVATLTRREPEAVAAAVNTLTMTMSDFANETGLQRLWDALHMAENFGVPIEAIAGWATPAPDAAIARDLRNTVKARYEPEDWQRIAQPVFDPLRQRQRDALVAYILHRNGFERLEQLFEYFLIDPGMEPVVQTSRLRLAISSVQTFIQRCLLNLEPKVPPAVINAQHWQWMKRYRVWEANRKIFLWPENWLEPEFRDDKTNLFQDFESTLLQGDISNDLAEDAFFTYLKELEKLARLDIVTMYGEEYHDPASNILHVIGRTHSLPHKYFYRRYAHQMWTPWEPVSTDIEGDHVAAVVWRGRLHLFWVTFLEKAEQDKNALDGLSDSASVARIVKSASTVAPKKTVDIQLNWSEYFQGQWTTRESSGFGEPIHVEVGTGFDKRTVFIHVSKESARENGEEVEGAVRIHLHFQSIPAVLSLIRGLFLPLDLAFRVVSKNSPPHPVDGDVPQTPPYIVERGDQATRYRGSGALQVTFVETITTESGKPPNPVSVTNPVLNQSGRFSLLACANALTLPTAEIASLTSPIFYQDDEYTFFVEPTLNETTTERWEHWGIMPAQLDLARADDRWKNCVLLPAIPVRRGPQQDLIEPIDTLARFTIQPQRDWTTDPTTALVFDGRLIGQAGSAALPTSGVTVIGSGGLNRVVLRNAAALPGLNRNASVPDAHMTP